MSAKYYLFKNPPRSGDTEEKERYHVRLTQKGTIPFRQICKEIASASTISAADSKGAITGLVDVLIRHLREGYTVEIDGLGYFKAIATSPPVENPDKVRAEHIQYGGVSFRPSMEFTDRMKNMTFVKDPAYRKYIRRTQEERLATILYYLQENPFIKSSDCIRINGCSRYAAQKDLNLLCEQGAIQSHGQRSTRFYTLTQTHTT